MALLSYLGIVYAFIVDKLVFKEEFNPIEMGASLVILIVALGTALCKLIS